MDLKEILNVRHLSVDFRNESRMLRAVDNASFSLKAGETLAIVGESGSGKSVTALSLMGLVPKPGGKISSGNIYFEGGTGILDLAALPEKQLRKIRGKEISMIFQEPMTSLNPVYTCGDQVSEILIRHMKLSHGEARERTIELFNEVQLPRPELMFRSYPHQLSGGQKQRVMISMAVSCHPKILIADEPTTALDVTVQKTILELLKSLRQRYMMSILFITHDLGLVSGFADRVLVMYKGRAVEEGLTESVFREPVHPYTKGLVNCRPPLGKRIERLPVVEDFLSGKEEILKPKEITSVERDRRHEVIYAQAALLSVKNLRTVFHENTFFGRPKNIIKAVDDVTFEVYPGETLGIVGESGCGKTTLGRTILQLISISSGSITYAGKNLKELNSEQMRRIRREIQIVFQDPYSSLNPRIMVGDAIIEPMKVHGIHKDANIRRKKAIDLLNLVGIDEGGFYRYPHEFSGGQRQRICIARALSLEPRLVICDESVSALDVSVQAQVLNLLNDLKERMNFTCIFISHDLSVVRYMSDRIMVMKDGRIEEMAEADALFRKPEKLYTKKLLDAIPGVQVIKNIH